MDHYPSSIINSDSRFYPGSLCKRLGEDAPARLWTIGHRDLLLLPKIALFCSKSCPGDAILRAMDQARKWREQGHCIISGFHSPIEAEKPPNLLNKFPGGQFPTPTLEADRSKLVSERMIFRQQGMGHRVVGNGLVSFQFKKKGRFI